MAARRDDAKLDDRTLVGAVAWFTIADLELRCYFHLGTLPWVKE